MRHSVIAALWFASAAGGAASAMAQEEVEVLSVPANIIAPSDRLRMETSPLGYDTHNEDEARHVCASCATLDGDHSSMTEGLQCRLSSRRAVEECLVGVDRGGHSKGWHL